MDYLINTRVGVVHANGCATLRHIQVRNLAPWDPAKAHLAPGVTACPACLREVPAAAPASVPTDLERLEAVVQVLKRYAATYPNGRSRLYYRIWRAINEGK